MRFSDDALAQLLRTVLAAHLVPDVEAPVNYSVRLATAPEHRRATGFHLLYRGHSLVLRTRDPDRLVRGLLHHLDSHGATPSGLLKVQGVALMGARGALVAPVVLRQYLAKVERRLNVRGVRIADAPWVHIDWREREVVVSSPALELDWTALDALGERAPDSRADPPVPPGRYPMIGWAFAGEGGPPTRALAVALGARLTAGSLDLDLQGHLDALAHVMSGLEPARLEWREPAELAAPLVAMMGVAG